MKNQKKIQILKNEPSSFRDPAGFIFWENGRVFRKINQEYFENFSLLKNSGLLDELQQRKLLVTHKEIGDFVLEPEVIPFVSYPYEWSFSQLKDAAILTLEIQKIALSRGMSLKDATAFNIQFLRGKPIHIDTLSFEKYQEGEPWVAYRQFCEQFLAPLTLTVYTDVRLNQLLTSNLDGIPLDLARKLLPTKAKFNTGILMHLFLHANSQKKHESKKTIDRKQGAIGKTSLLGLIDSLERTTQNLVWKYPKMAWTDYGAEDYFESYTKNTLEAKKRLVDKYITSVKPNYLWDLGANTGTFSKIAAKKGIFTLLLDGDPTAIEQAYKQIKETGEENILPLFLNLANPTPATGFENIERKSFFDRPKPDMVLALALIHHLAIGNNLPLSRLSNFFGKLAPRLIIEFVPKDDPQTQRLLASREDIFPDYSKRGFENEFSKVFKIENETALPNSKRIVYLMTKK